MPFKFLPQIVLASKTPSLSLYSRDLDAKSPVKMQL